MRVNAAARSGITTHEGAAARRITHEQQLRRLVLACMLWEDTFYVDGQDVAKQIRDAARMVSPEVLAALAVEARTDHRLRHAPLLLARELARHPLSKGALIGDTIAAVIQRADELAEFLAIYWQDNGRRALSKQVKRGLAKAFQKFDAYQLAKYNRAKAVKLRDVLFLCHAKPSNEAQAEIWGKLVQGTLEAPDTWEVGLSGGGDKRETFERLIDERKLGYMALLRNLRGMLEVGVDRAKIEGALREGASRSKALPFRFVAAARAAPTLEPVLDECMTVAMQELPRFDGRTNVLVDVSGSMGARLSQRSDLSRMDAACALGALVRGVCDDARVFSFSSYLVEVPARQGMALIDAIRTSQPNRATNLAEAVSRVDDGSRLIVITDEQATHSPPANPKGRGYMINVANYRNGVGYGPWVHVDGFSEQVIRFIQETEAINSAA